jgi:hypothetical protein
MTCENECNYKHAKTRRTDTILLWAGCMVALATVMVSAQTLKFVPLGSIPGPVDLIRVQGTYAYVAAARTLTIFDISNPAAPRREGAYTFPEKIWGFRVAGSLAYVAADFFGLGILDISNAAAPVLRGSIKTPGQAKNVDVFAGKAVVSDHMSGVDYVDVSNSAKPASLGSYFLDGCAKDVAVSGSLAYAVDAPTGLYVFDLSKPGPLAAVSEQQSASDSRGRGVAVSDPAAEGPNLAVLIGGGLLQVYDVSSPASPVKVATFRLPGEGAQRGSFKGKLAYMANGREGLQVVDLSTPDMPKIVGAYQTAGLARDVAVKDFLVFVVVGAGGGKGEVLILRQTP